MYCPNCGAKNDDGAVFCTSCGTRIGGEAPAQPMQPMSQPVYAPSTGYGGGRIGWSPVINTPEFRAAIQKQKKATTIFSLFIVPLPLLGFLIYSLVTKQSEMPLSTALTIGGIVSVIFLLFAVVPRIVQSGKSTWDGTVVNKETKLESVSQRDGDGNNYRTTEMVYYVYIRRDDGKNHKIRERGIHPAYDYFNAGERLRYHPELSGWPYEKYDKSHDPYVICPFCSSSIHTDDERCPRCKAPALR